MRTLRVGARDDERLVFGADPHDRFGQAAERRGERQTVLLCEVGKTPERHIEQ